MYNIGQKVIYSDLSPWEVATVVGLKSDITEQTLINVGLGEDVKPSDFDYILDFGEGDLCPVQRDGIREYTPENVQKYLGEYIAPPDEFLV